MLQWTPDVIQHLLDVCWVVIVRWKLYLVELVLLGHLLGEVFVMQIQGPHVRRVVTKVNLVRVVVLETVGVVHRIRVITHSVAVNQLWYVMGNGKQRVQMDLCQPVNLLAIIIVPLEEEALLPFINVTVEVVLR